MIADYRCKETRKLKAEGSSRKLRSIERVALRKLDMLEAAVNVESLRAIILKPCTETEKVNTAFASTANGVSVSPGATGMFMMLKLSIIIEEV